MLCVARHCIRAKGRLSKCMGTARLKGPMLHRQVPWEVRTMVLSCFVWHAPCHCHGDRLRQGLVWEGSHLVSRTGLNYTPAPAAEGSFAVIRSIMWAHRRTSKNTGSLNSLFFSGQEAKTPLCPWTSLNKPKLYRILGFFGRNQTGHSKTHPRES